MFSFINKIFKFFLYSLTALGACIFSLFLVLNFMGPAFSENSPKQEIEISVKKVFSGILENIKDFFKPFFKDKEKSKENQTENKNPSPPESFEGNPEGFVIKNGEQVEGEPSVPSPESFESEGEPSVPPPESFESEGEPSVPSPESFESEEESSVPSSPESFESEEEPSVPSSPESFESEEESSVPSPESFESEGESSVPSPESFESEGEPSVPSPESFESEGEPSVPSAESFESEEPALFENFEQLPSDINLKVREYLAPFIYDTVDARSPFTEPLTNTTTDLSIFTKTPPEKYELAEIQLKGIIWSDSPKALFELPDNQGHYNLRRGDRIGKNSGVIFEIREDQVVIVETLYVGQGEDKKERRVVKIKNMDRLRLNE
ncbi:MAG: pilus assembly protein PilP [Bdellovibrionales bacterium]|nr:pilus assembly protein PilP [Bdellovibrionales bacterium]